MTPDPASIVDPETGLSPREAAEALFRLCGTLADDLLSNPFTCGWMLGLFHVGGNRPDVVATLAKWHASRALTPEKVAEIVKTAKSELYTEEAMYGVDRLDEAIIGIENIAEEIIKMLESTHGE